MNSVFDLPTALSALLYGGEPPDQALDRLTTPGFVHRINGLIYGRTDFLAYANEMRQLADGGGQVRVLDQLSTGNGIAGRYLFRMTGVCFESHLFARIDGDRLGQLVEVVRRIEEDDDVDLLAHH